MLGKYLGSGAFGKVYESEADNKYVYKIINMINNENIKNEIEILEKIKHQPYLCDLLTTFEKEDQMYLKFNKYYCNLFQYKKPLNQNEILLISLQVLESLEYLHFKGIIHCDLKPENIMFETSNCKKIRIIDFGSSIIVKRRNMYYNYIQTRWYCSPDVILGKPITIHIDIWSLGCIIYELYTRNVLFKGKKSCNLSRKFQLHRIIEVLGIPSESYLSDCLMRARYFIYKRTLIPKDNNYNLIKEINDKGEEIILEKRNLDDEVTNPSILKLIKEMLKYDQRLSIEMLKSLNMDLFTIKKQKLKE